MLTISTVLLLSAEPIINTVLGKEYEASVLLLQIMSFIPFFVALSNIYGIQTMLNLGYKQAFSRIILGAAILGLSLSFVLVPVYEGLGTAVTLLFVELFVTVVMYFYLKIKVRSYL